MGECMRSVWGVYGECMGSVWIVSPGSGTRDLLVFFDTWHATDPAFTCSCNPGIRYYAKPAASHITDEFINE